jgi:hypothetical protein
MRKRIVSGLVVIAVAAFTTAALTARTSDRPSADGLTIHEWGTFTTVADQHGRAVDWYPLGGPTDLPCFVEHFTNRIGLVSPGLVPAQYSQGVTGDSALPLPGPANYGSLLVGKVAGVVVTRNRFDYAATRANVRGKVRMETPVLYFYAPTDMFADVRVDFPRGLMTEWYPRAVVTQGDVETSTLLDTSQVGSISWKSIAIRPSATPAYAESEGSSHYYEARATDASPLFVNGQAEKFLFYRGIANFEVPLSAEVLKSGAVRITNLGGNPIPAVVLFENRGGKLGYRLGGAVQGGGDVTLASPSLTGSFDSLRVDLEQMLVSAGLYPKEAAAMVATWRGSWFEEGVRVFYVLPSRSMDAILPLAVDPAPVATARTFVGRMELITPAVQSAVAHAVAVNDTIAIERQARFFGAIADRVLATTTDVGLIQRYRDVENGLLASYVKRASVCEQAQ